jgi:hypothetical protein
MPYDYMIDEYVPCSGLGSPVAILLVGYNKDHWIAKGSWGQDLGDNGFFKIKMFGGGSGICGILSRSFYPII